ncbi:hypothetical protein E3983_00910 [Legionella israelensis]|uniref:EthD domain-containing protein n=1 Tax=Legionella israelensis TaxID=454 RepID=A0AAX1ED62_9GAMM|nr:DUF4286 family protein [Legionella israelensis]QBR83038.1 hypothetical protein E3983_00910 [Legionella israelensis]
MNKKALIIVSLNIDSEKEAEFNDFYHHVYIPKLMDLVPEIESAKRYEEHNVDGTLRYYNKQFLTIYQCASESMAKQALQAIQTRSGREQEKSEWNTWQSKYLHGIQEACIYTQRYEHPRRTWDGIFGGRPFFMVSVEVTPEKSTSFNDWYEQIYLPKNLADVPTWAACRRYSSYDRSPVRDFTIYEAWDLTGLQESLELMRSYSRLKENASWKQWDSGENSAITWEDATSFKPIFNYPY